MNLSKLNTEDLDTLEDKLNNILSTDERINQAKETVRKVFNLSAPVLITGETGTGKELFAQALHYSRVGKFLPVNVAAIPDTLLDTAFFGSKRGAYTDSKEDRIGYVEEAKDGTLFLDEIGELSLPLQAKLLRFLQDRSYYRVGDSSIRYSNCRIISATNKPNLWSRKDFRKDLYYRLSVIKIHLKPLRERPEQDISLLVDKYVTADIDKSVLSAFIYKQLTSNDEFQQGNIRSVVNICENVNIFQNLNQVLNNYETNQ